jgi:hypothetical protein
MDMIRIWGLEGFDLISDQRGGKGVGVLAAGHSVVQNVLAIKMYQY